MKTITKLMFNEFNIKNVDFMGYYVNRNNASFHHLIIPRRLDGPETIDNGAVLNGLTSHPYLHAIESRDLEIFYKITSEMIDENIKRRIDVDNLRRIDDLLKCFEREYCNSRTAKGKLLIKEEYTKRFYK